MTPFEERQLRDKVADLEAFVDSLRQSGLDRLTESGYLQFDGIPMRWNPVGMQVQSPLAGGTGIGQVGMWFVPKLSTDPGPLNASTSLFPRSAVQGFANDTIDQAFIAIEADAVFNDTLGRVFVSALPASVTATMQTSNAANANPIAQLEIYNPDGGPATAILTLNGVTYDLTDSGDVATDTIFDAKGDLPVGTGADTADNLPVGTNGAILMADSTVGTFGLKWTTAYGQLQYVGRTTAWGASWYEYVNCTSGTFQVTAPAGNGNAGKWMVIKNSGTGAITVAPNGAETIEGSTTPIVLAQYDSLTLIADGSNVEII